MEQTMYGNEAPPNTAVLYPDPENPHPPFANDEEDGGGEDSMDDVSPHLQYEPHSHSQALHDGAMETDASVDGISSRGFYAPAGLESVSGMAAGSGADQLTLSFQGEVYVFDAVSPEKVQAVLLLLGGYEVPLSFPTDGVPSQNQRATSEFPGKLNQHQRAVSLNRFREKRKDRCFDKKIRYTVRKEVALRMQRKRGQFASPQSMSDGSSSADCNSNSGQEDQETFCSHCGIGSKSTPMMRRGPAGPRSLCNACGLKWAAKGLLGDVSKAPSTHVHDHNVS
ncbi:unnamed protein product [Cuscuta campestris]|uniref:CCT domain-containing protein n=1 Tax=Cuscuta campestris TaxID=132261 RepID=A0A484M1F8_9ASTE|nr:unnamed protein product [Cuscuta campestris]